MQSIETLVSQPLTASDESPKPRNNVTAMRPPLLPSMIRALWVRMAEIYGHKWTSAFGDSESGAAQTWAKGLRGLTSRQLADGLEACLISAEPWPPTAPEFRALCFGIPSLARVKLELRSAGQRCLFTHLVWQFVDSTAYGAAQGDKADRLLRDAYGLAREHVMCGFSLPDDETDTVAVVHEKWKYKTPPPEHRQAVLATARAEVFADDEGIPA